MNKQKSEFYLTMSSVQLIMFITLSVTIVTFGTAIFHTTPDMNLFDFCLNAVNPISYSFVLILVSLSALPFCILLFKESNISLSSLFYKKDCIVGDILYGLLGAILSGLITLVMSPLFKNFSTISHPSSTMPVSTIVLRFVALVIVSGILKELYFRGLALHIISKTLGENKALFLTNILFGILDWYNLGDSFFSGLIWAYFYKKRPRLIVPIIAHALVNALGVIFYYLL